MAPIYYPYDPYLKQSLRVQIIKSVIIKLSRNEENKLLLRSLPETKKRPEKINFQVF